MVTYLVGTDGVSASETICDFFTKKVGPEDHLEVFHVLSTDDIDVIEAGEAALQVFEERLGGQVSLNTTQLNRGRSPTDELVEQAEKVDADEMVTALRRHSRTERVIFGSVSHSLLQRVTIPITLVPLAEYQPSDD